MQIEATDVGEFHRTGAPASLAALNAAVEVSTMTADAARVAARGEGKHEYVQRMFADIAPRYDLLNHLLSLNIDRRWRKRALAQLGWERAPRGTYLDLCAGTLDVGATLVKTTGFGGFVAGADFAMPMLRHGLGKAPATRLAPVGADAMRLPFGDGVFDGAIVAFGIRNVAGLDPALREVRRVLRVGAKFVILEFTTPHNAVMRRAYHAYFHHLLPFVGRLVSGHASAYAYLPESVAHFPNETRLEQHLSEAGFDDVRWDRLTFGIAAIHVGTAR